MQNKNVILRLSNICLKLVWQLEISQEIAKYENKPQEAYLTTTMTIKMLLLSTFQTGFRGDQSAANIILFLQTLTHPKTAE
jgi:hypothetical protein